MNHKIWKLIRYTVVLALLMAVLSGVGSNQPVQARATLPVMVPADVEWVSTGIWIFSGWVGYPFTIRTSGTVMTIQGCPGCRVGPTGSEVGVCEDSMEGEIVYTCALAGEPWGKLIGRVGNTVFPIGDDTTLIFPNSGFFYLTVNDYLGTYYDNAGEFTVLIDIK